MASNNELTYDRVSDGYLENSFVFVTDEAATHVTLAEQTAVTRQFPNSHDTLSTQGVMCEPVLYEQLPFHKAD